MRVHVSLTAALCVLAIVGCGDNATEPTPNVATAGLNLPSHDALRTKLRDVLERKNGGLGFEMWASFVNRDGVVQEVVFSGTNRADQWPGSRVISAQKANTANSFSLEGFALSTGNLLGAVGVSGDTSCTDHVIAWRLRHALNLDNVPAGVADGGADDNLIYTD